MQHTSIQKTGLTICRVEDLMAHARRYDFQGRIRFASDSGISVSTLRRIIVGETQMPFVVIVKVTEALEKQFKCRIDPRDVVSLGGAFPTPFACQVVGCAGCHPVSARDEFGALKEIYKSIKPGEWVSSRYPLGFNYKGGIHA
jgi:hypothetical protein